MAYSTYSFQDSLTIHNNRHLKWLDTTGTSRSNVISMDAFNNVNLGSSFGDVYINSSSTRNSYTFMNASSGGVIVPNRLGVGFSSTSFSSTVALCKNAYIGLHTDEGFLGLAAGSSASTGSKIVMYNNTTGGHLDIHSGTGSIGLYIGDSEKVQVTTTGSVNFMPDGTTIKATISRDQMTLNSDLVITSTSESMGPSTGALQVRGGMGVAGDLSVSGTLSIASVTGNINFDSSQSSVSSTTGAIFITGGLGISNTMDATSVSSGGGITCSGGVAVRKQMYLGGALNITNTTPASNSVTGSIVTYGGIGANGAICVRTYDEPQVRIAPVNNNSPSTISFYTGNNFSGSKWIMGHLGTGKFGVTFGDSIASTAIEISTSGSVTVSGDMYLGGPVLAVPKGTTAGRPSNATTGSIRFNTDLNQFEGYLNSTWGSIGGGGSASDLDGTTFLAPEIAPGVGDGNLRFVTKNVERMRINSAGNIGIGTSSPAFSLEVVGDVNIQLGLTAGSTYVEGTLDVLNDSTFYGAITNASDIRLKENIQDLGSVLDKINDIRTVRFNYRYANRQQPQIGFIAQDFLDHFPELTKKTMDDFYTLDYSKCTVLLLQCIKDLRSEVLDLRTKVLDLQAKVID